MVVLPNITLETYPTVITQPQNQIPISLPIHLCYGRSNKVYIGLAPGEADRVTAFRVI